MLTGPYNAGLILDADNNVMAELRGHASLTGLDAVIDMLGLTRVQPLTVAMESAGETAGWLTLHWVNTNLGVYLLGLLCLLGSVPVVIRLERSRLSPKAEPKPPPREPRRAEPGQVGDASTLLVTLDPEGRITQVTGKGAEPLGLSPSQLIGWTLDQLDGATRTLLEPLRRALTGDASRVTHVIGQRAFEGWYHPLDGDDRGAAVILGDITERERTLIDLRQREERLALAAQGAIDGLWHWNLESGELYVSPRWKAMVGAANQPFGTDPDEWFKRVKPEDAKRVRARLDSHLEGHTPHFESEYRILHTDGSDRWMLSRGLAVRDPQGRAVRIAGSQTDITERKLVENQLLHDALHDDLTGLPNRAMFMERLTKAITKARRDSQHRYAVLFLDLDQFKMVNDSLGHTVGDQLLIAVARRLEVFVRPGDTVARLGGDEFIVLLEDLAEMNDAMMIADRIQQELSLSFALNGSEVFTTASIGIAVSTADYERPGDVIRDADTAMYRAKSQGRARHEVFHRGMHHQAVQLLQLETDLRRAVERKEFEVYYQPIISLADDSIAGFEALIRWPHPQRGYIPPEEFIPIAEETGLIIPIGRWVMRQACRQTRVWRDQFPHLPKLSVTVNLSATQLGQPDLIEQVARILDETGLPARCLRLEITESVVMEDVESVIDVLLKLKNLNVQILMDDFGTGYSSLSYLHRFPIDMLKIDRSFVSRMDASGENSEIVSTIVMLARNLDLGVVAEGVETPSQKARLKAIHCDYGQGYLFSKPANSKKAARLLASAGHTSRLSNMDSQG